MYSLHCEQYVKTSLKEAWNFLKRPENLNRITPKDLHFSIVSEVPEEMHNGLLVEYRIKIPYLGIHRWVAEIKHIREMHSFVDEQRIGPYNFWYHYHELIAEGEHVKIRDRVNYKVPYGILGKAIHFLFIRKTLQRIFTYRKEQIEAILTPKSQV